MQSRFVLPVTPTSRSFMSGLRKWLVFIIIGILGFYLIHQATGQHRQTIIDQWQNAGAALRSGASHLSPIQCDDTPPPPPRVETVTATVTVTVTAAAPISQPTPPQDALASFRKTPNCTFTSYELVDDHPQQQACTDRTSVLHAMSDGGRLGFDLPYMPRGCNIKWYSMAEICDIMGRFDTVHLIGDSFVRHLGQAFNVLLREDLWGGARATWRDDNPEGIDCSCYEVFNQVPCYWWSAVESGPVTTYEPDSYKCGNSTPELTFNSLTAYPLKEEDLQGFLDRIQQRDVPTGREVFVFGHGGWNSFEVNMTEAWLTQIDDGMRTTMPPFYEPGVAFEKFPRLFLSPHAQGVNKPGKYVSTQNNIKLAMHERAMRAIVPERGLEHLGCWNLTIQATSPDGTHASFPNSLVKAMMIMNWLDMLQPDVRQTQDPQ